MKSPRKPRPPRKTVFLGLLRVTANRKGKAVLRPNWLRVLAVLGILLVIGWLGKSFLLLYMYKERRDYRDVSFAQTFLYPLNKGEMTQTFGDWQIEEGKKALEAQDPRAAYLYLKQGVARSPANREGRLLLASFEQMAIGNMDQALDTLRDGLEYHRDDVEYLQVYLRLLMVTRHDEELLEMAQETLPEPGSQELDMADQLIAYCAAQVAGFHGDYAKAMDYLRDYGLLENPDGIALRASLLWKTGRRDEAVDMLTAYGAANPRANSIQMLLSQYLRELGRDREAVLAALTRATGQPESFAARLDLLRSYAAADREEALQREVTNYLRDFGDDQVALIQLMNWATAQADPTLSGRVYRSAAENGYDMGPFGLLNIESHLAARDFTKAEALCQFLEKERAPWIESPRYSGQFNFLRACAAMGLGNTEMAQLYMGRVIEERLDPNVLISMAMRFRSLGMEEQARATYRRALDLDPDNELALTGLVEIDLDQNTDDQFVRHVSRLLDLRRPDYSLLERARERLLSDRFVYAPRRSEVLAGVRDALAERDVEL